MLLKIAFRILYKKKQIQTTYLFWHKIDILPENTFGMVSTLLKRCWNLVTNDVIPYILTEQALAEMRLVIMNLNSGNSQSLPAEVSHKVEATTYKIS